GIAIRDFQIPSSGMAKELLIFIDDNYDLLPDALFVMLHENGKQLLSVAIEIERYAKSDDRTIMKLRRFASGTRIDGVIWLCDGAGIANRLRRLYKSRVMPRANRINNYGNNFMLFQDDNLYSVNPTLSLRNVANEEDKIASWMS